MTLQYRATPFSPDGFGATATAFNRVSLTWTDRSHNERRFRIERSVGGGAWTWVTDVGKVDPPLQSGSWGDTTLPNTNYCYRTRAENDWGGVGPWVNSPCRTTPHALGTVSGVFNGSFWTACVGRVGGSGATSYREVAYQYTTGYLLGWTVNDNASCYGAVLFNAQGLANDYYHFAARACNAYGCSGYRDMTNPNQYWTVMPGGASAGGGADPNYHAH